jgi:antitoxin component of RelBE/YafQ-DinJ toxin-antitoxin module
VAKPVNKPFSTRLPDEVRAALQARAQAIGVTESDLGRMFIIEKLAEAKTDPLSVEARSLAALTIAALSETIDLDQAEELVRQHLAQKASVSQ